MEDTKAKELDLPPLQLYDLSEDIAEENNVADQHPEIVQQLTELMTQYVENGRSTPGTSQSNEGEVVVMKSEEVKE